MDLTNIIIALKERCPSFGEAPNRRFAGAAEFAALQEEQSMDFPSGYVIPMDDEVLEQQSQNGYRQIIRDMFAVVVVFNNKQDGRGQHAVAQAVNRIRKELFRALLTWEPDEEHTRIEYEGGTVLHVNRAHLYYQFEFSAQTVILEEDTWQAVHNAALPAFLSMGIEMDCIDPYDPNLVSIGPDGRIEVHAELVIPQTQET
ncbi:phage tail terminator protein [Methylobacillus pratensis]